MRSLPLSCALALQGALLAQYTEIEPNQTRAQALANGVFTMAAGSTITGVTTGSTTVATATGTANADTFLIQVAALPPGIYRHRLVVTSATVGHTLNILCTQLSSGNENVAQTSQPTSTPPRMLQWYGFGRAELLDVRVLGAVATTQPYTVTMSTTPVAAVDVPGQFAPGDITISAQGFGSTFDSAVTVFDATLHEIADYKNDDPLVFTGSSLPFTLRRTYAPGTYHLAVSGYQQIGTYPETSTNPTANWFYGPSLGGEFAAVTQVLDHPDSICRTSGNAVGSFPFSITDSANTTSEQAVSLQMYDIVWFRMVVGSPCAAPVVTSSPASIEACFGNTVNLSVTATGTAPLGYQWFFNATPIPTANAATLTLPTIDFSFAGIYTCQVTNGCGNATSTPATVTVHPAGPEITDQPDAQTLCIGATASFTVAAVARMQGALSYQWFKDGQPIPLANTATLTFTVAGIGDGGQYVCRVDELGCGAADSDAALLTVRNAAPVVTLVGPSTITLECGIDTYVEYGATVADDCDSGLVATIGGTPIHNHPEGHYVVTYDAVDSQSNQAVQVQRHVYVVDRIRPTVTVAVATPVLWSPRHEMVNVGLSVQTFDACEPAAAAANVTVEVYCDEIELPDTGDGTGRHSPDAKEIAPGTLRLRSERSGANNGRVYVIVARTEDAAGNAGFGFTTVVCPSAQNATALAAVQQQATAAINSLQAQLVQLNRFEDAAQVLTLQGYHKHGIGTESGPFQ